MPVLHGHGTGEAVLPVPGRYLGRGRPDPQYNAARLRIDRVQQQEDDHRDADEYDGRHRCPAQQVTSHGPRPLPAEVSANYALASVLSSLASTPSTESVSMSAFGVGSSAAMPKAFVVPWAGSGCRVLRWPRPPSGGMGPGALPQGVGGRQDPARPDALAGQVCWVRLAGGVPMIHARCRISRRTA